MANDTNDNISEWSENPSENNSFGDINFYEGMPPSMVNNSARAMMASIRKYYQDKTYARQPTLGGNNLQVTLDSTFTDYVDGMVVRFRIPNDFSASVPDNLMLCVNNIPSDKRGNSGNGLPMISLQWDATNKKLAFMQAKGNMFVPGAHINAIYSSIHHIWTQADYTAEQAGKQHLIGDTYALLQTDPHWAEYASDPGVFFIFSDSDMSAIQAMAQDIANDAASNSTYGCTNFPVSNDSDWTGSITKLGIQKNVASNCMKIVQYSDESIFIGDWNEGTVITSGTQKLIPAADADTIGEGATVWMEAIEKCLLPLNPFTGAPQLPAQGGWIRIDDCVSAGLFSAETLESNHVIHAEFTVKEPQTLTAQLGYYINPAEVPIISGFTCQMAIAVNGMFLVLTGDVDDPGAYPQPRSSDFGAYPGGGHILGTVDFQVLAGANTVDQYCFLNLRPAKWEQQISCILSYNSSAANVFHLNELKISVKVN